MTLYDKIDCNYVAIFLPCAGLKKPSFILRFAALLLIVVFSQKAGTGLFLHNLFHTSKSMSGFPEDKGEKGNDISYACSCIDDFLMPFDEDAKTIFQQPVLDPVHPLSFIIESVPYQASVYSSLRGPPAMNL